MKKKRKPTKKLSPSKFSVKALSEDYSIDSGVDFYTVNSFAERQILEIKISGNVYKVVKFNSEAKIVARIDNTLYNFPVIIAAPGSKEKLAKAYAELRERESLAEVEE
jgi:hypothetical protein